MPRVVEGTRGARAWASFRPLRREGAAAERRDGRRVAGSDVEACWHRENVDIGERSVVGRRDRATHVLRLRVKSSAEATSEDFGGKQLEFGRRLEGVGRLMKKSIGRGEVARRIVSLRERA